MSRCTSPQVRQRIQAKLTEKTNLALAYKAELNTLQFQNRELKRANRRAMEIEAALGVYQQQVSSDSSHATACNRA